MSQCENLDGQCALSWCNCDEVRARQAHSLQRDCSLAHVHFEITTSAGNRAIIKGDPNMPEETRKALAAMIDALAKAVERGDFKAPENE